MFGLSGKVLEWFRYYLEQLYQGMSVHSIVSDIQLLLSGAPQGSVLRLWFSQCIPLTSLPLIVCKTENFVGEIWLKLRIFSRDSLHMIDQAKLFSIKSLKCANI